jgi:hypothetical protein
MRKTGRHCEAAQPTKQSMFIITFRFSGLLPAAFRAVAMTIISADYHSNCLSPDILFPMKSQSVLKVWIAALLAVARNDETKPICVIARRASDVAIQKNAIFKMPL